MKKGALDCASARCSMEAGCRLESDGFWICICTQDFSIPRADGSCPRIVGNSLIPIQFIVYHFFFNLKQVSSATFLSYLNP